MTVCGCVIDEIVLNHQCLNRSQLNVIKHITKHRTGDHSTTQTVTINPIWIFWIAFKTHHAITLGNTIPIGAPGWPEFGFFEQNPR